MEINLSIVTAGSAGTGQTKQEVHSQNSGHIDV